MKKMNRIFASLLLCLMLVTALAPAAAAASVDANITITGKDDPFQFEPGSSYSSTDLFPNFKNVFPGDTIRQEVYITHKGVGLNTLKVFMRAVPHSDPQNKPQTPVLQHEGSVEAMNDFLSQLDLKIWMGKDTSKTPIFHSSPDQPGNLKDFFLLGQFKKGAKGVLTVELSVPITMGNEYADRMGEVDWEFMIEEIPPAVIPQTGDQSNVHVMIAVSVVSFAAIVVVLVILLKKKKK